ncbi:hypothetical protein LOAG_10444 [Loa loa]|uniref:Uncharacterized protein n=1 Tax=Loa loa TaxID=7209 RepID=A0A1I7VJQ4_LOALO|nr:hypothetical protein LOAG_10444 [Loa loa]EFO18055.1 hypothetical protein LOAG_10444 [Loa loa]
MHHAFNNSNETDSLYLDEDDDGIGGDMILQGLVKMPTSITSTVAPTGRPEVVLALTIVLVILVILLIISIFLLLYCVLRRQGRSAEQRKWENERRKRHKVKSKTIFTDSARKAKVSQIAASIEAAVKSAESTSKFPKPSKQLPPSTPIPALLPRPKPMPKKLSPSSSQSETAVEAPSLSINQIFVNRWRGPWQQIDHEPSDFSYELESDSVNDDICLQPL